MGDGFIEIPHGGTRAIGIMPHSRDDREKVSPRRH
jgi:hypothetical protein